MDGYNDLGASLLKMSFSCSLFRRAYMNLWVLAVTGARKRSVALEAARCLDHSVQRAAMYCEVCDFNTSSYVFSSLAPVKIHVEQMFK